MTDYPDFEGQKSKLFTAADWSAVLATDKNFRVIASLKTFGQSHSGTYNVPAASTLYIVGMAVGCRADAAADADKDQVAHGYLLNAAVTVADLLCNGGNGITFPKPIVVDGGNTFTYGVYCYANHSCTIYVSCWGYEL